MARKSGPAAKTMPKTQTRVGFVNLVSQRPGDTVIVPKKRK